MSEAKNTLVTGAIDLIGGSLGGTANVLVGQPLDTIKVKMQTFPHLYKNAFTCFRETFLKDGIRRGLYAGVTPAIIANVAENSVLFCAYGMCQKVVQKITQTETLAPTGKAFAGSLAAFFAALALCPTELVKCKLQALRESAKLDSKIGPFRLTRDIIRSEGVLGLFKGLTATIAREMPGYFCFFGSYEISKKYLKQAMNEKPNTANDTSESSVNIGELLVTIIGGGIGGVCFWVSIFPFDVVKSRLQVESSNSSTMSMLVKIAKREGVRGLYKGLLPTVIRTFPSTGALFVTYEYSTKFMANTAKRCDLLD